MASGKCLQELFSDVVEKFGDNRAVALYHEDSTSSVVTYRHVYDLAKQLSKCLITECEGTRENIGLYIGTCIELPSVILGILMSGQSFAPISLSSPTNVIGKFITHANMQYIVTTELLLGRIVKAATFCGATITTVHLQKNSECQSVQLVLCFVNKCGKTPNESFSDINNKNTFTRTAYVLCTSGTTGFPKMVAVPHSSIIPNIIHLRQLFNVCPVDKISMLSPLTFDPSVVEMFLALTSGATLVLVSDSVKIRTRILSHILFNVAEVTIFQATPSFLHHFTKTDYLKTIFSPTSTLKVLSIGGEQCPTYKTIKSWIDPNIVHPKIRIFNLYGITEVSVWSTYYELPMEKIQQGLDEKIPLGYPLLETSLCLISKDESRILCTFELLSLDIERKSTVVAANIDLQAKDFESEENILESYLWLGSSTRICEINSGQLGSSNPTKTGFKNLLGADKVDKNTVYRKTGDIVSLQFTSTSASACLSPNCEKFYYIGRTDYQIKRNGKRMNLLHVKNSLEKCECVLVAHVLQCNSETVNNNEPLLVAFVVLKPNFIQEIKSGLEIIESHAQECLDSHCVPDKFIHINQVPMTAHGKVDETVLKEINQSSNHKNRNISCHDKTCHNSTCQFCNHKLVKEVLLDCWNKCLHPIPAANIGHSVHKTNPSEVSLQNFVTAGGNSLLAVKFVTLVEHLLPVQCNLPNLLHVVLQETFVHVCSYVSDSLHNRFNSSQAKSNKRHIAHTVISQSKKQHLTNNDKIFKALVFRRGGLKTNIKLQQENQTVKQHCDSFELDLINVWKYNTGKCIDASPVVVTSGNCSKGKVIIGSHSYLFACLDMSSGNLLWSKKLGDRVESSACLTPCGQFVCVGCYDGYVYFLSILTGELTWRFETGGEVKSSPCPGCTGSSQVFVGSHDGNLYCLDAEASEMKWTYNCGSAAVFSSPCLWSANKEGVPLDVVYACTLSGRVLALHEASAEKRWAVDLGKPIFSSPACAETGVFVGNVDCKMYMLSHTDGSILWTFSTRKPIFSSPAICISNQDVKTLAFGSHDGTTYCVDLNGKELWNYRPDKDSDCPPVYATPYPFEITWENEKKENLTVDLLATASTDGTLSILDARTGRCVARKSLPGHVFSSPVVIPQQAVAEENPMDSGRATIGSLFIGCRDDNIYMFHLTKVKSALIAVERFEGVIAMHVKKTSWCH